jgi:plastocyanin
MRRTGVVIAMATVLLAARGGGVTTSGVAKARAGVAANTVTVQMIGSSSGYKFDPASVTIKTGDQVKFVNVSGGPHNVSFDPQGIPSGAAAVLQKNMPNQQSPLIGPLLINPNDSYTVSFAGAPAGSYKVYCLPHQALNMTGTITVQ